MTVACGASENAPNGKRIRKRPFRQDDLLDHVGIIGLILGGMLWAPAITKPGYIISRRFRVASALDVSSLIFAAPDLAAVPVAA